MSMSNRNSGTAWSSADRRELDRLASQNTPTRVIGLKLGRTPAAVLNQASKQGTSLKPTNQAPTIDALGDDRQGPESMGAASHQFSRSNPAMYLRERFVVEERILRNNPDDAIRIVRLGALANAITSTIGLLAGSLASPTGRQRDVLQGTLILISYFKEVVDQIDHPRPWELINTAVNGGFQLPKPVPQLRQTFSRGRTSFYKKRAIDIRHKKGFHVDPDHFREWLDQLQAPFVTLWRRERPVPHDQTFTASAQIQSFFGKNLEAEDTQIFKDITSVPLLVEAMAGGLLLKNRVDPRSAYVELKRQYIRIEYTFTDGRPPATERLSMLFDANGFLEGVVHQLRDHVTRRFGGRRAGAGITGPHDPVLLSSPFGTARAWPDGPDDSVEDEDTDHVNLRLLHMAEAGRKSVEQSMEMAELLRKMRAPMPDLAVRLENLRAEHEWWSGKLRYAEAQIERSRPGSGPSVDG